MPETVWIYNQAKSGFPIDELHSINLVINSNKCNISNIDCHEVLLKWIERNVKIGTQLVQQWLFVHMVYLLSIGLDFEIVYCTDEDTKKVFRFRTSNPDRHIFCYVEYVNVFYRMHLTIIPATCTNEEMIEQYSHFR